MLCVYVCVWFPVVQVMQRVSHSALHQSRPAAAVQTAKTRAGTANTAGSSTQSTVQNLNTMSYREARQQFYHFVFVGHEPNAGWSDTNHVLSWNAVCFGYI